MQVEHLNKDIENMNVQRQQENQSFIRHREEMERQVQDQRKQVAAVHEQMRTQEENFNAERQVSWQSYSMEGAVIALSIKLGIHLMLICFVV